MHPPTPSIPGTNPQKKKIIPNNAANYSILYVLWLGRAAICLDRAGTKTSSCCVGASERQTFMLFPLSLSCLGALFRQPFWGLETIGNQICTDGTRTTVHRCAFLDVHECAVCHSRVSPSSRRATPVQRALPSRLVFFFFFLFPFWLVLLINLVVGLFSFVFYLTL